MGKPYPGHTLYTLFKELLCNKFYSCKDVFHSGFRINIEIQECFTRTEKEIKYEKRRIHSEKNNKIIRFLKLLFHMEPFILLKEVLERMKTGLCASLCFHISINSAGWSFYGNKDNKIKK